MSHEALLCSRHGLATCVCHGEGAFGVVCNLVTALRHLAYVGNRGPWKREDDVATHGKKPARLVCPTLVRTRNLGLGGYGARAPSRREYCIS